MFEEINGLPTHPLVVHATVVLVPLLCLAALVYTLVPRTRGALRWVTVALAVVAPAAAVLATQTGESLLESRYPDRVPELIHEHEEFGDATLYTSIGLGLATLVLLYLTGTAAGRRLPSWISPVLAVVVALLSVATGFYVVRTGDSGAQSVWGS